MCDLNPESKAKSDQSLWQRLHSYFTVVPSEPVVLECLCLCTAVPPLLFVNSLYRLMINKHNSLVIALTCRPSPEWLTAFDHLFLAPVGVFSQHLNSLEWWKYLMSTNTLCLTPSQSNNFNSQLVVSPFLRRDKRRCSPQPITTWLLVSPLSASLHHTPTVPGIPSTI